MADISKVKLPDGSIYNIKDSGAARINRGVEFVSGCWVTDTNASSSAVGIGEAGSMTVGEEGEPTGKWIAATEDGELYDGKKIILFMSTAHISTLLDNDNSIVGTSEAGSMIVGTGNSVVGSGVVGSMVVGSEIIIGGRASLDLILNDGSMTGAKNIYFWADTQMTDEYSLNSQVMLIYHDALTINGTVYQGWWNVSGIPSAVGVSF